MRKDSEENKTQQPAEKTTARDQQGLLGYVFRAVFGPWQDKVTSRFERRKALRTSYLTKK